MSPRLSKLFMTVRQSSMFLRRSIGYGRGIRFSLVGRGGQSMMLSPNRLLDDDVLDRELEGGGRSTSPIGPDEAVRRDVEVAARSSTAKSA